MYTIGRAKLKGTPVRYIRSESVPLMATLTPKTVTKWQWFVVKNKEAIGSAMLFVCLALFFVQVL